MPLRSAATHVIWHKSPEADHLLKHIWRAALELPPCFCISPSVWAPKPNGAEGPGGAQPTPAGPCFGHPNLTCIPGGLVLGLIFISCHVLSSSCCQGLCVFTVTVKRDFLIRFLMHLYLLRISQSDGSLHAFGLCWLCNYSDGAGFPRSCQPWRCVHAGGAQAVGSGFMVALGLRGGRWQ